MARLISLLIPIAVCIIYQAAGNDSHLGVMVRIREPMPPEEFEDILEDEVVGKHDLSEFIPVEDFAKFYWRIYQTQTLPFHNTPRGIVDQESGKLDNPFKVTASQKLDYKRFQRLEAAIQKMLLARPPKHFDFHSFNMDNDDSKEQEFLRTGTSRKDKFANLQRKKDEQEFESFQNVAMKIPYGEDSPMLNSKENEEGSKQTEDTKLYQKVISATSREITQGEPELNEWHETEYPHSYGQSRKKMLMQDSLSSEEEPEEKEEFDNDQQPTENLPLKETSYISREEIDETPIQLQDEESDSSIPNEYKLHIEENEKQKNILQMYLLNENSSENEKRLVNLSPRRKPQSRLSSSFPERLSHEPIPQNLEDISSPGEGDLQFRQPVYLARNPVEPAAISQLKNSRGDHDRLKTDYSFDDPSKLPADTFLLFHPKTYLCQPRPTYFPITPICMEWIPVNLQ